ncbi:hypothetical protein WMF20_50055 [Sorangium sp. So ce834]|uniref:hypothetical protein n=1 Tax=Sorangium sp. So ce834 TaxID=3133321 RepID=UPI003F5FBB15
MRIEPLVEPGDIIEVVRIGVDGELPLHPEIRDLEAVALHDLLQGSVEHGALPLYDHPPGVQGVCRRPAALALAPRGRADERR